MKDSITLERYNNVRTRLLRRNKRYAMEIQELEELQKSDKLSLAGVENLAGLKAEQRTREDIIDLLDAEFDLPIFDELKPLTKEELKDLK